METKFNPLSAVYTATSTDTALVEGAGTDVFSARNPSI